MKPVSIAAALIATTISAAPAFAASVHVGVNIGIPAPPHIVFQAPPRLVVVPGVPAVHYAPDVSVNYFSYGDRYYTYDSGNWFVAYEDRGPWTYVERRYVPAPILRVPSRYYRVPPRLVGGGHWHDGHRHYKSHKSNWRGDHHDRHGGGKWHKGHGKGHGHHKGHGNGHHKHH